MSPGSLHGSWHLSGSEETRVYVAGQSCTHQKVPLLAMTNALLAGHLQCGRVIHWMRSLLLN